MKLFGVTRLSAKLLAIFIPIFGISLISLFTVIETQEYAAERRELVIALQQLVETQRVPITTALWELDSEKINSFLSEVVRLDFVQGGVVTDASGKIVASSGDIDTQPKSSDFIVREALIFQSGSNSETIGSIKIIAHDREILREATNRVKNHTLVFVVLMLVLTGATIFATNRVVGRPLTRLHESIEKIRRDGVHERVDWDSSDELGQVVSAYNEVQSVKEETENALRRERNNLEVRVKERTKKLAGARDRAKAAEKTIFESEQRLQSILKASPIGWASVRADGTILDTNERLCKFLEMSRADVLKTNAAELYSDPADRLSAMEHVRKNGFLRNREIAFKKSNGTRVWALMSLESTQYKGKPAIFGWIYDITERKEREEERLRQSQKMEILGQLTGSVAHDFNNILTVLDCNIDLLKSKDSRQKEQLSLLDNCIEAVELGSNLTARLTKFARKKPLAETRVDLNSLIDGFSDLLNRSVGKKVTIEYVLPDDTLPILADATLLEIGLLNLATNARDAMSEGGVITISLSATNVDEKMESLYGKAEPGSYALLQVSDTGIGMAPETKDRVFEAFFTTKDEGKGTGLGLSTVQDLVQSAGGFVQIESEPGQGTAVKIFLPLYEEKSP